MTFGKRLWKMLVLVPLVGAWVTTFACYITEPFLAPHTYVAENDFYRLVEVYLGKRPENASPAPMSHETYTARVKDLADKNGAPLNGTLFEKPVTYFGPFPSNSFEGALVFMEAASSAVKDPQALATLMERRQKILAAFMESETQGALKTHLAQPMKGAAAPFALYLQGAFAFYTHAPGEGRVFFEKAVAATPHKSFWEKLQAIFGRKDPTWLAQSALYMQGRCALVAAQARVSEFDICVSCKENLDLIALKQARALFKTYLDTYPEGLYAASAKGLSRKLDRLEDHKDTLNESLRTLLNTAAQKDPLSKDLYTPIDEFVNFFTGKPNPAKDAPLTLACGLMRFGGNLDDKDMRAALVSLESRTKDFAPYPGLALFLKALILTRLHDAAGVTSFPQESGRNLNKVQQGTAILRATALMTLQKYEEALATLRALKKSLSDDHLDLLILRAHLNLKNAPGMFLVEITSPRVRELYLERFCTTPDLETLNATLTTSNDLTPLVKNALKRRYLLVGSFEEAQKARLLDKDEAGVVAAFLKDKDSASAQQRTGEWLSKHTGPWRGLANDDDDLATLCPECKEVTLPLTPPLDYFMAALKAPKGGDSDAAARALHDLTSVCFRGNAPAYGCLWTHNWWEDTRLKKIHDHNVPLWFKTLKTRHKNSSWAKKTPYHY